jgi:hypothetical protein
MTDLYQNIFGELLLAKVSSHLFSVDWAKFEKARTAINRSFRVERPHPSLSGGAGKLHLIAFCWI